ncbi:Flagella_associated protein [Hexamita inflata]|uniref:Flagella associated protein n=1 Tax=Hexamita inflata TaxID=28002 RepID=A0AA86QST6_9EUKA|nr:Flagella associated protein [Hexamita inflata]
MSINSKDIPFLPGTVFADPRKTDFKKSHILDKSATSVLCDDEKALRNPQGATSTPLCERGTLKIDTQKFAPQKSLIQGMKEVINYYDPSKTSDRGVIGCRKNMIVETPEGVKLDAIKTIHRDHDAERAFAKSIPKFEPAFVKLDGAVLRFYAWTQIEVQESQDEKVRIKHVIIDYTVLDGTLMVYERPIANAGQLQGEILKRQRVPLDYRNKEAGYIGVNDLKVRQSLELFGMTYNIYACSADTRVFLKNEGIQLEQDVADEDVPRDEYITTRQARLQELTAKQNITKDVADDKLAKYLRHDREVLNFQAYWDNRDSVFGEVRYFTIQYFLADDNVQVLEVLPQNSGRDPFPQFVRKQKVPKKYKMTMFSEQSEATQEFYSARDFKLGQFVDIYNRQMFIYDCDQFTRDYMLQEFNMTMDEVRPADSKQKQILDSKPNINNPETLSTLSREQASKLFHSDVHGIGSEEDTIGSCLSVHPVPPKKNVINWMKFGDLCIKFLAKFVPYKGKDVHVTDVDRKFIMTYYFADQSVSIFEVQSGSSQGFGNRFLERTKLKNIPLMEQQEGDEYGRGVGNIYYNFTDFKIGATIECLGCAMKIFETDKRSTAILDALEKVGNDLNKFDPRMF